MVTKTTKKISRNVVRKERRSPRSIFLATLALVSSSIAPALAASISIPNGSFESPFATFGVDPHIDSWQKTAQPPDYDPSGNYLWEQLTGVFQNTTNTSPDHIDNCDGNQAAWMFADPEVGLFQDYNTMDWNDSTPTHAFNAIFEPGKSYHLKLGLIGGGYGMLDGVTLQLSLYYRDALSNQVIVGAATIAYNSTIFTNRTHFIDFSADVPAVKASDPWAGKNIGIQILSTVDTNLQGGYWDLDNVRLTSIREPVLVNPAVTNRQFSFSVQSEPGYNVEILAATNLPAASWTSLGTFSNVSGTVSFSQMTTNAPRRYYRARRLP